jgi:hypothetical protein
VANKFQRGEWEKCDNLKIDHCEVNIGPIDVCFRQGRPGYVFTLGFQGLLKRSKALGETIKFEIGYFASKIFGPDSLGLVERYGWFVL